jgi:hypothetical protein
MQIKEKKKKKKKEEKLIWLLDVSMRRFESLYGFLSQSDASLVSEILV